MRNIFRFVLVAVSLSALTACSLTSPSKNATVFSGDVPAVVLNLQASNASDVFNTIGQTIKYSYVITNNGTTPLAGPVTVSDDKVTTVACPDLNTVGNKDGNLDPAESITCASAYAITQADLDAGSVINNAKAKVDAVESKPVSGLVRMTENKVLTLTTSASSTTYSQSGQIITFTYSIKNTGTPTLGPAQFIVKDDRIGAPFNCGGPATLLATNEAVTCTTTYTIAQSDTTVNQIVGNATASGAGAGVAQPTSLTLTNTNVVSNPGTPSTSLTRGSTIQHKVVDGEWMLQIARCYGADYNAIRNANPQVTNPHRINPDMILSIPNIGSNGTVYGPPCVGYYTSQNGDTWNSIAQKYNADIAVLQEANSGIALSGGVKIRVPLNSASKNQPSPSTGAIRINIPTGATTVALPGNVNTPATVRYVLNAAQGQSISVKVTIPTNDVTITVSASNGAVLKSADANLNWGGSILSNGDYYIDIASASGAANKTFTLEVGLTSPASSAFERVADINVGAGNSNPAYLTKFNNALFFSANGNDGAGNELWKYDSATNKPSRVADINLGAGDSNPSFLAVLTTDLYFRANGNDNGGIELWRFNGSATGRLTDINAGAGDSNPAYMTLFNNALYFSAKGSDGFGVELWKTDGTNTTRVTDIYKDAGDANPAYLTVFNNALYFSATSNDGKGTELWKFDGTNATRVSDINPELGNANPAYLTVFNNMLYFSANANDGKGTELWKYDGTNASLAYDINVGAGDSNPAYLTVFNNALYFSANGNDGAGVELWKYDGTNAKRVIDINKAGDSNPSFLAVFNNELYFQANGGDGAGIELWKFKGP